MLITHFSKKMKARVLSENEQALLESFFLASLFKLVFLATVLLFSDKRIQSFYLAHNKGSRIFADYVLLGNYATYSELPIFNSIFEAGFQTVL